MGTTYFQKTPTIVLVFRFISGRHLDGDQRTDSTFLRQGERDFTPHNTATRWHYMAGWKRTAWRLIPPPFIAANGLAYVIHPDVTLAGWSLTATGGLAYGGRRVYLKTVNWKHRRNKVRPIYIALSGRLGLSTRDNPERYLSFPRDYSTNEEAVVRLNLPPTLFIADGDMHGINRFMLRKLGAGPTGEWDFLVNQSDEKPYLEWRPVPQPPEVVPFEDMRDELIAADTAELILGMGTHNRVVKVNLDSEAPHIAFSMPTGGGKSIAMRWILMQLSRWGYQIDIIDPKFVSQNWAVGLPGVRIHRDVESQMDCIEKFDNEMNARYRRIGDGDPDEFDFARRFLIIEEWGSWTPELKAFWTDYRNSLSSQERGMVPAKNPALELVAAQLRKSRQVKMHVLGIFQRLSAAATGDNSGDMRENFGAFILGGKTSNKTWKMLVDDGKAPKKSTVRGRSHLILGETPIRYQGGIATVSEARQFALSGPVPKSVQDGTEPVDTPVNVNNGTVEPARHTLADLAKILEVKPTVLYNARDRDPEFPTRDDRRYTESEMRRFLRNRRKAGRNA
jgi:hypothetical protein